MSQQSRLCPIKAITAVLYILCKDKCGLQVVTKRYLCHFQDQIRSSPPDRRRLVHLSHLRLHSLPLRLHWRYHTFTLYQGIPSQEEQVLPQTDHKLFSTLQLKFEILCAGSSCQPFLCVVGIFATLYIVPSYEGHDSCTVHAGERSKVSWWVGKLRLFWVGLGPQALP